MSKVQLEVLEKYIKSCILDKNELKIDDLTLPDYEFLKDYYHVNQGGGWFGWHCEGSPLKSLFFLIFWDILFPFVNEGDNNEYNDYQFDYDFDAKEAIIEDVFVSKYQDAPLDLDYNCFYHNR